ncbi:DUF4362 domain-containing protein [Sporosarcina jeotgali]|uniref:DUF4362 domain-containing protein n=1 Tax=Sporosarcina jeotgali TaxID=3020056 RepID=A0ABZ0KW65_9BACL|nr:DUF4362 domain-containing protein [Sporosarcina sp. B2O-1]WOV83104.1 DUF4362 domain-containing protein [Sporosarcina sp. B2O-1]
MKKVSILILLSLSLFGCGDYSPSKHDVVNTLGTIKNLDLLEKFSEDVSNNKDSEVRVVNYTDEGDPIIHDLKYSDEKLSSKLDTRFDEFGDHGVIEDTCKSIEIIEKSDRTIYRLRGCEVYKDGLPITIIPTD